MKFIPYDKLSKKKKRELDRRKRGSWGGMSPVTRRAENPKAYKRKKIRPSDDGEAYFSRRDGYKTKSFKWDSSLCYTIEEQTGEGRRTWPEARSRSSSCCI